MASFTSMNFNSDSDSDDGDFVPNEKELAAGSGDESTANRPQKKKKLTKKATKSGISLDEEEDELSAKQKLAEEEARKKEFEKEKVEKEEAAMTKKTDDLWADFLKDTSTTSKPASESKKPAFSEEASTHSKPTVAASVAAPKPKKKTADSIMASIFDQFEKKDDSKNDSDSKPASENTSKESPKEETSQKTMSIMDSIFSSFEKKSEVKAKSTQEKEEKGEDDGKVTITRVFDFAGEAVEVSKKVDADSKEGQKFLKAQDEAPKKRPAATSSGGLSNLVNSINKKPKMGCLDKSKMDWDQYVAKEGIKEELETFNKGKDGYVEKQMFLERADHRRFEQEKAAREKTRTPLNR